MFSSRSAVIFLLSMLCTGPALAQNTSTSLAQNRSTSQDANSQEATTLRSSQRRNSSLLDRSDMQSPKPIPVVKPLRFQEIPVATDANGAQVPNTLLPAQPGYPAATVTTPQPPESMPNPDGR
jgi:hypothetical protein